MLTRIHDVLYVCFSTALLAHTILAFSEHGPRMRQRAEELRQNWRQARYRHALGTGLSMAIIGIVTVQYLLEFTIDLLRHSS